MREDAKLLDVFRAYPDTARPLLDYHETLMHGPSPLSVAERALVAPYVSVLNACGYCEGVHQATAERFGITGETLIGLLNDIETASVEDRIRALLRYLGKLTISPARVSASDAGAVLDASEPLTSRRTGIPRPWCAARPNGRAVVEERT